MKCERGRHLCVRESCAVHGVIGTKSERLMRKGRVNVIIQKDTWSLLGCAAVKCVLSGVLVQFTLLNRLHTKLSF